MISGRRPRKQINRIYNEDIIDEAITVEKFSADLALTLRTLIYNVANLTTPGFYGTFTILNNSTAPNNLTFTVQSRTNNSATGIVDTTQILGSTVLAAGGLTRVITLGIGERLTNSSTEIRITYSFATSNPLTLTPTGITVISSIPPEINLRVNSGFINNGTISLGLDSVAPPTSNLTLTTTSNVRYDITNFNGTTVSGTGPFSSSSLVPSPTGNGNVFTLRLLMSDTCDISFSVVSGFGAGAPTIVETSSLYSKLGEYTVFNEKIKTLNLEIRNVPIGGTPTLNVFAIPKIAMIPKRRVNASGGALHFQSSFFGPAYGITTSTPPASDARWIDFMPEGPTSGVTLFNVNIVSLTKTSTSVPFSTFNYNNIQLETLPFPTLATILGTTNVGYAVNPIVNQTSRPETGNAWGEPQPLSTAAGSGQPGTLTLTWSYALTDGGPRVNVVQTFTANS